MFKIEYLGSVPDLPPWSPHLWHFVPRSKYVHYQVRKYGLDVPNIELSTFRSTRFHHWSGAWFWHCDFCVRDGVCLSLWIFSPSFLSLWRSQLHCLVRLNYSEWRYNDGGLIMPHAYFVLCKLGRGNTLAMHCGQKNNFQLNYLTLLFPIWTGYICLLWSFVVGVTEVSDTPAKDHILKCKIYKRYWSNFLFRFVS